MTQKTETPLDRLIGVVGTLARRWLDISDFSSKRLTSIEDRLRHLDGGDDAAAARRAALSAANIDRIVSSREKLSFSLEGPEAKIKWADNEEK